MVVSSLVGFFSDGVKLGNRVYLSPGVVIEKNAIIGDNTYIGPNTVIKRRVVIGKNCNIGANVVIGERGFGYNKNGDNWELMAQIGSVIIGDNVDIGAGSTIDCGTLDNTIIENGVKLDNQVQVGHNVIIKTNTIISGCTGIAGSTTIGKRNMIGGGTLISDHISTVDDVILYGGSSVISAIKTPGIYASAPLLQSKGAWGRTLMIMKRLASIIKRLSFIEKKLGFK